MEAASFHKLNPKIAYKGALVRINKLKVSDIYSILRRDWVDDLGNNERLDTINRGYQLSYINPYDVTTFLEKMYSNKNLKSKMKSIFYKFFYNNFMREFQKRKCHPLLLRSRDWIPFLERLSILHPH
jgi:hypothetical protein